MRAGRCGWMRMDAGGWDAESDGMRETHGNANASGGSAHEPRSLARPASPGPPRPARALATCEPCFVRLPRPGLLTMPPFPPSAHSFLSLPPSRHWGFSCCCCCSCCCCASQATKLRSGIRLVQRQKELKSAYLVRFGESADLLGETLALYWQRCNMLLREPQRCCNEYGSEQQLHSRSRLS